MLSTVREKLTILLLKFEGAFLQDTMYYRCSQNINIGYRNTRRRALICFGFCSIIWFETLGPLVHLTCLDRLPIMQGYLLLIRKHFAHKGICYDLKSKCSISFTYKSHHIRKPTFCICKNKGADQLRNN